MEDTYPGPDDKCGICGNYFAEDDPADDARCRDCHGPEENPDERYDIERDRRFFAPEGGAPSPHC